MLRFEEGLREGVMSAVVETDVLVVGAGPAGASSAVFLSKHGVRTIMISRHRSTSETPRAHITQSRCRTTGHSVSRPAWAGERVQCIVRHGPGRLCDSPACLVVRRDSTRLLPVGTRWGVPIGATVGPMAGGTHGTA